MTRSWQQQVRRLSGLKPCHGRGLGSVEEEQIHTFEGYPWKRGGVELARTESVTCLGRVVCGLLCAGRSSALWDAKCR